MSQIQNLEDQLIEALGADQYAEWDGDVEALPEEIRTVGAQLNAVLEAEPSQD